MAPSHGEAAGVDGDGNAEVGQLGRIEVGLGCARDEDVGRFDVTVDDPTIVDVGEGAAQARAEPGHLLFGQRRVPYPLGEGRSVDKFGDQIVDAAGCCRLADVGVENGHQSGVAQRGQKLNLAAVARICVEQIGPRAEDLDGHVCSGAVVIGTVHRRHPAAADDFSQLVPVTEQASSPGRRPATFCRRASSGGANGLGGGLGAAIGNVGRLSVKMRLADCHLALDLLPYTRMEVRYPSRGTHKLDFRGRGSARSTCEIGAR